MSNPDNKPTTLRNDLKWVMGQHVKQQLEADEDSVMIPVHILLDGDKFVPAREATPEQWEQAMDWSVGPGLDEAIRELESLIRVGVGYALYHGGNKARKAG